jgi:hypothetical protein
MGEDGKIRGAPPRPDRSQKRAVKPPPVLITSLQIETGWKLKIFPFLQDGCIRNP